MSRVPDEMMERLHEANELFHLARLRLIEAGNLGLKEQLDASNAIHAAELGVEDITREIHEAMTPGHPAIPTGAAAQHQSGPGVYGRSQHAARH